EAHVERVALRLLQRDLQLRPPVGGLPAQQLLDGHVERGRERLQQRQLGLALAVLQEGELARRPPDAFGQVSEGEPALLAQVLEPLPEGQQVELVRQRQLFFAGDGGHISDPRRKNDTSSTPPVTRVTRLV